MVLTGYQTAEKLVSSSTNTTGNLRMKYYLIILIILAIFLVGFNISHASVDYPKGCTHTRSDFYNNLRILEIRLIDVEDDGTLNYVFEDVGIMRVGKMQLTRQSFIGHELTRGDIFIVVYCIKHTEEKPNIIFIEISVKKNTHTLSHEY